ncbi:MAG TPA: fibrobacter succinogenes major paralogous domain-containing protein [Bacteroidales bacterium]|nr:fibrobacter succinogenes major paralogous domain-containing protein [Bacteroidales bacterium]
MYERRSRSSLFLLLAVAAGTAFFISAGCKKPDSGSTGNTGGTVTDIDGNVYHTVVIGSQTWMKENLATVHYRNGDPVPRITVDSLWINADSGAYCNYNNDTSLVKTYGRLYNWYAVTDLRQLAPAGWHIPSDSEWMQLERFLGMTQEQADSEGFRGTTEGGRLKEAGTQYWWTPNQGASNSTGFSARPGGYRDYACHDLQALGNFWTSSETQYQEGIYRGLENNESRICRNAYFFDQTDGFSVRCIKDR